jgi:hypothetical protein
MEQLRTSPSDVGFGQTRCGLITIVKSTEDFIESLLEKLLLWLHHSSAATEQTMVLGELKCRVLSTGI